MKTLEAPPSSLHQAAARHAFEEVRRLLQAGVDVQGRDQRGALPLHWAAMALPGAVATAGRRQRLTLEALLQADAHPDAVDRHGATALHWAVRCRSAAAVKVLLAAGADARRPNGRGSMPLHLAVQVSGIKGSGAMAVRYQQRGIITLLLRHGARVSDQNAAGRTVLECARSAWLREVLGQDLS